jgi:hypothetical protein
MVKFNLGAYLNTITSEKNPDRLRVFELVQWATLRIGWTTFWPVRST